MDICDLDLIYLFICFVLFFFSVRCLIDGGLQVYSACKKHQAAVHSDRFDLCEKGRSECLWCL